MVREYSFRQRFSHPNSLFFYRSKDAVVDLNRSFANINRPSRYILQKTNKALLPKKRKRSKISSSQERDFSGTADVPVYVTLPLGIINMECKLVDPEGLRKQLTTLKSAKVDGVVVEAWWGIVEANNPQQYNWEGYKHLFSILRDVHFEIQVVMSFYEYQGNDGDDVHIPLPKWIQEIGQENPDIYFTDRHGTRNHETLTWGIDEEPVLRGRTALQVYEDYMRSFRVEFDKYFRSRAYKHVTEIEIGLGACGVLRYPSSHAGIAEFQCYDKYLKRSLKKAAEASGQSSWGSPPKNAGSYDDSQPQDTEFLCDSDYGRFFLNWYSQYLIDHGDRVLAVANLAVKGAPVSIKISGMDWWYKTDSPAAAELTAGFYNEVGGFAPIASMLKKHRATLNFTWSPMDNGQQEQEGFLEAMVDPVWQVVSVARDDGIKVSCESALTCYDKKGCNQILELAKPRNGPKKRHLYAFTYRRLNQALLEQHNLKEFQLFVNRMHGAEDVEDL